MADRNLELAGLVKDQRRERIEDASQPARGGRYVQHAFPGGPQKKAPATTSKVRFGERPRFSDDQYAALAKKAAPGPRDGKSMAELQEEARRRRAADRAAERSR